MKSILYLLVMTMSMGMQAGLSLDTLVSTPTGNVALAHLRRGDMVYAYSDFGVHAVPIIARAIKLITDCVVITVGDNTITMAKDHRLYLSVEQSYVAASQVRVGDKIMTARCGAQAVTNCAICEGEQVVIDLALAGPHSFCVGHYGIVVHNFFCAIPLLSITFGQGVALASSAVIAGSVGTSFVREGIKKIARGMGATIGYGGGSDFNNHWDPDDEEGSRNKVIKSASKVAEELGFKKTNYYSHGRPVYKKGNRYITQDVDSHNGGFWKMADSAEKLFSKKTRMGTYDQFLNRIGD